MNQNPTMEIKMNKNVIWCLLVAVIVGVFTMLFIAEHQRTAKLEKLILAQQAPKEVQPKFTKEELVQKFIEQIGTNVPPKWTDKIIPKVSMTNNKNSKVRKLLETYIDPEPMPHFTQKDVSLKRLNALKSCTCDIHQPCWLLKPCTNSTCECCSNWK